MPGAEREEGEDESGGSGTWAVSPQKTVHRQDKQNKAQGGATKTDACVTKHTNTTLSQCRVLAVTPCEKRATGLCGDVEAQREGRSLIRSVFH